MSEAARIGQATPRIDGNLKVSGAARYPSDQPLSQAAHAFLLTSAIACGSIRSFDLHEALAVEGVLDILTYQNVGGLARPPPPPGGKGGATTTTLESARIWHAGQIIALVVAESFEAAREAAYRVRVSYEEAQPAATLESSGAHIEAVAEVDEDHEDPCVGDAPAAWAAAPVRIDESYCTPTQHHNALELFTTTCEWQGEQLTIHEPSQFVKGLAVAVARQLGIPAERVRVLSAFVGGAFGSRGGVTHRTAWVAIAARRLGRAVKLVATRQQGFTIATYRAETRQRVRLAAAPDGKLQALMHESWEATSRPCAYHVSGTTTTARIYACPNVSTRVHVVHLDRNTPGFMRAPPDMPYMFALECALDELAVALRMDPVQLRLINDTDREPIKGLPYTSRSLRECFAQGAASFEWSRRAPEPGSMRNGPWRIGLGCATATYPSNVGSASARVIVSSGRARVQIGGHDIGTGAYTAVALTAAERLGLRVENVAVELGDSDLPPAGLAAGSSHTASLCNAVALACERIRSEPGSEGAHEAYVEYVPDGAPHDGVRKLYAGGLAMARGNELSDRIAYGFGAQFVEVWVHERTAEIRVPRAVGAFAAGTIVNPLTARSQFIGGMIWGISAALHEATEIDARLGRYMNADLAEYLIPVNADVGQIEAIMLPEADERVNALGIKGIGELGIVGMNAAVANAVYHATGRRIRELPIRLEKLL
jgi:xanthine dehydrogenase YagR molybdenum-binding subunit